MEAYVLYRKRKQLDPTSDPGPNIYLKHHLFPLDSTIDILGKHQTGLIFSCLPNIGHCMYKLALTLLGEKKWYDAWYWKGKEIYFSTNKKYLFNPDTNQSMTKKRYYHTIWSFYRYIFQCQIIQFLGIFLIDTCKNICTRIFLETLFVVEKN